MPTNINTMTPKEAKEFFEQLKTAHELPNDNSGQYNIGYVDAMNTAINTVKKLVLADVGGSAINVDELIEKMNKIRNDEAFKGVLSFDYPNEIIEVIDALETLR